MVRTGRRSSTGSDDCFLSSARFDSISRFRAAFLYAAALLCASSAGAQSVVSLSSPLTETLYALGAQDHLLGVSDVCVFPGQVLADRHSGKVREVGGFTKPDYELIDRLHPDVILTSTGFQEGIAARFRTKGYRVLHFEPHSLAEVLKQMEDVGEAVGKGAEARMLTADIRAGRDEIRRKSAALPKVRVYIELNHEGPWTLGAHSPLNDIIMAAGGENIFGDRDEEVFIVRNEEIIRRNPDIILSPIWTNAKVGGRDGIIPLAQIFARPGYAATKAVKNSRVLYYDSALLKQEGPRQILAIEKLAYLLHPEAFENPSKTIPWELGRIVQ